MSLNWNYRAVSATGQAMIEAAWIGAKGDERNPALDSVIWATVAIGVGQWTSANMETVQHRMAIYQYLNGPAITFGDGRQYYVTPEEIAKLEGLSTNVTKETDAAFAKKVMKWVLENAERAIRAGGKQYLEEGGPDLDQACGAFQALANAEAKRKAEAEASQAGAAATS